MRDKTHMEQAERWACYVRDHPNGWKKIHTEFINALFKKQEDFANCIICVVHQTNYLLDKLLNSLEKEFLEKGGFSERMYRSRIRTFYS